VLANAPPDVLRAAIANEQTDVLTRVPAVGTRTAKAIILHLKESRRWLGACSCVLSH
jgi:Holliday junction resolvasome RuvABC DNA-binding subunit